MACILNHLFPPLFKKPLASEFILRSPCGHRADLRLCEGPPVPLSNGIVSLLKSIPASTRECHVLRADRALKSGDVIRLVKEAIEQHGAPEYIRSDNGSEFIAKELQQWLADQKIRTIYIEPASPWQNGFVESFHGRFRDECLNREQLWTLTEARVVIEDFRIDYNTRRPHSRLGYRSPLHYAAQLTAVPTPVGLRPPSVGTASTTTDRSTHNNIPD